MKFKLLTWANIGRQSYDLEMESEDLDSDGVKKQLDFQQEKKLNVQIHLSM